MEMSMGGQIQHIALATGAPTRRVKALLAELFAAPGR
jgi:hypothetical protein